MHFLKKKLRSTEEISQFLSKLTDEEKYIGALPDKWREKFDPADLKDKTKQIQHLFSEFAKDSFSSRETPARELSKQIKNLSKSLEEILGEKCMVKFIDSGQYGKVFKVQCAGEDLALKVYHNNSSTHLLHAHGRTKEIANAVAMNYSLKPNQCARFYCGKATLNDDPSAFMLSQFVHNEGKIKPKEKFCAWIYKKFNLGDHYGERNIIGGKIIDFGAINYNFKNPAQQDYAKELYPLIIKGDSKSILQMKEKYANCPEFNDFLSKIINLIEFRLDVDSSIIAHKALNGWLTRENIAAYRALGIDFSEIENYDYSKAPQKIIQALKNLGLSINC